MSISPDLLADTILSAICLLAMFIWTLLLARKRRLPSLYALFALIPITGTVFVATLDKRAEDKGPFRARLRERFRKHPFLLTLLTLAMGIWLAVGFLSLLAIPLRHIIPVRCYVNGREVEAYGYLISIIPGDILLMATGLFHFLFTRRRVKALTQLQ